MLPAPKALLIPCWDTNPSTRGITSITNGEWDRLLMALSSFVKEG